MLLDLAFPRRCPVCDRPVKPSNAYICSECREKLVYIKEPRCRKCGKQLEKAENEYCYDCGSKRHIYDRGAALYSYGSIRLSLYLSLIHIYLQQAFILRMCTSWWKYCTGWPTEAIR